jgi:uncharacterized repeat protein (TIGR03803 family)
MLTTLHNFAGVNGAGPRAALTWGSDGSLYGTTRLGGTSNAGIIFRLGGDGALKNLHSFKGIDGAEPLAELITAPDGALYGTTFRGGVSNAGTVFTYRPGLGVQTLHSFTGSGGSFPASGLVRDADGTLYGTTQFGGAAGRGIIFEIGANGSFGILHQFSNIGGRGPAGSMAIGADGTIFGTTSAGSSPATTYGSVFRFDRVGGLATLHGFAFNDFANGAEPRAELTVAPDGSLLGTTFDGGPNGRGAIFRLSAAGNYQLLHAFTDFAGGDGPLGGIISDAAGNLFGTTAFGGNGFGTVFKLDVNGGFSVLHRFAGMDGNSPTGRLLADSAGNLFGTTTGGGSQNLGTIFRISGVGFVTPPPSSAIPEPATWAMLIAGFGLVGASLRRRRSALV